MFLQNNDEGTQDMWMNEHEVEEAADLYGERSYEYPNLYAGARVLYTLMRWTNDNSDGWPYWQKPARAADALMTLLHSKDYALRFGHDRIGNPLEDITAAELTRVLSPIKAFLTRQGVDHSAVLPWAAIL
jgi:hypothetical protein